MTSPCSLRALLLTGALTLTLLPQPSSAEGKTDEAASTDAEDAAPTPRAKKAKEPAGPKVISLDKFRKTFKARLKR